MKRIKNMLKWATIVFFVLFISGILFRGVLYRQFFSYKSNGQRSTYLVTQKEFSNYIDSKTASFKPENIHDIINRSLQLTSERLNFRKSQSDKDPNYLVSTRNAHCVGYSAFFSATCNYLLNKYGFSNSWTSEHLIGQIYFCGVNVHDFSTSSFFKDHDFNSITNRKTGEKYFVDPTINDYLRIQFVRSK